MQQTRRDLYEVLGVDRGSSPEDIKKAFRRLASQSDDPDQHRAARACLLPDALLYATHAIGAMAARAEAIVGALPLAAPEPILDRIRSFRRVADELRRATIMVNGGTT